MSDFLPELKKIRKDLFFLIRNFDISDDRKTDLMEAHNIIIEVVKTEEERIRWKT